jgi:hypothetical protein
MVNYQARDLDRLFDAPKRLTAHVEAMQTEARAGEAGTMGE